MMKKILKNILIIYLLFTVYRGLTRDSQDDQNEFFLPQYILDNPDQSAIKIVRNDTVLLSHNPDKLLPLASTVKIIIAIEYAFQSVGGGIDNESLVAISDIDKFFLPQTDRAHKSWKKSVIDKLSNDSIEIKEVAKGMIKYSSNANTEFLQELLGLENINSRISNLNIKDHDYIYYLTSSMLLSEVLFPELLSKEAELVDSLNSLSISQVRTACSDIHLKLLNGEIDLENRYRNSLKVQKVWSSLLPASTVNEYIKIMSMLNNKKTFDKEVHELLDYLFEGLMENPKNQKWLEHSGSKGGSTVYVLTKASYATTKSGNRTEVVYLLNDLDKSGKFRKHLNIFHLKLFTSSKFRKQLVMMFE